MILAILNFDIQSQESSIFSQEEIQVLRKLNYEREIKEELNIEIKVLNRLHKIQHAYSHFKITMEAYSCQFIKGIPEPIGCSKFKWIFPKELNKFAFPKANHKLFSAIYDKSN